MKICLTGGPSAGKTTLAELLAKEFRRKATIVPEAASILFRGGFPRLEHSFSQKCQQRAIYSVQSELERQSQHLEKNKILICDRGTVDGAAYWPGKESEFYKAIDSSRKVELARYDWVLHLDTAAESAYQSSVTRIESPSAAQAINKKILTVWKHHPQRFVIHNDQNFSIKMQTALIIMDHILAGLSYSKIVEHLKTQHSRALP